MKTIIRVKRKRDEEPLDALCVEHENRNAKSARQDGPNEIQQVEQTSVEAFRKVRKPPVVKSVAATLSAGKGRNEPEKDSSDHSEQEGRRGKKRAFRRVEGVSAEDLRLKNPNSWSKSSSTSELSEGSRAVSIEGLGNVPDGDVKILDYVADGGFRKKRKNEHIEDSVMCNFLPMVKEYLNVSEGKNISYEDIATGQIEGTVVGKGKEAVQDSEWVYDLYYEDEWDNIKNLPAENIGHFKLFDDNLVLHDMDVDSSDEDLNLDEDSNDEGHWRNDYPDEEDGPGEDAYYESYGIAMNRITDIYDDAISASEEEGSSDEEGTSGYRRIYRNFDEFEKYYS
eukprot:Nk52_evm13s1810 gene=Nk52_evmTU13s1810